MNTENKPIALISTFTGIVKFYNPDGSRNLEHPDGFYHSRDLGFYKKHYFVNFSN